ncbi:class I SAM-dependent methyltransferase [Sphingobacterium griseoflavum]|uniref:THUMP-like domain-containing protein n=1 Tax=Sphingobacterium griseoflavum TaxID=1474952 RepID=A0ABQ3HXY5_9SPHI|nr:hypothetical protein [Sphingobacterium griseoflavum]GHE34089.1 hypothetical protein GCM10017764_16750 [Sphingobacterium griseoflavum]
MNKAILLQPVQDFLHQYRDASPSDIALRKSPFSDVPSSALAQQIDGRQRAARKIAPWTLVAGIYYPEKLSLEQCSSEETGHFKASLIRRGTKLIDLTGGFGVDSFYFASTAAEVSYCERNNDLAEIVAHNFQTLGLENIGCHPGDGLSLLKASNEHFDYIYIDPSRRVQQQKVFRLQDCEPNIVEHQTLFFSKARCILSKLAPLLDISLALQTLQYVKAVYVLSVQNDCKELLFLQEQGYEGDVQVHAVRILPQRRQIFSFNYAEEQAAESSLGPLGAYLYDPDVALTKAGAFKSLGNRFGLTKLHPHTHLYTSARLQADFPGRRFQVMAVHPLRSLKKGICIRKANVITKNFPLRVEDIRKKFKIADGGEDFLFFCTLHNGEHAAIHAQRLPEE